MDEEFAVFVRAAMPQLSKFGLALTGNPHDGAYATRTRSDARSFARPSCSRA